MEPTNRSRTEIIYRTMLVYAQYKDAECDTEELVINLLTDLRHYCDEYGFDLGQLDRIAHQHYLTETFGHPSAGRDLEES